MRWWMVGGVGGGWLGLALVLGLVLALAACAIMVEGRGVRFSLCGRWGSGSARRGELGGLRRRTWRLVVEGAWERRLCWARQPGAEGQVEVAEVGGAAWDGQAGGAGAGEEGRGDLVWWGEGEGAEVEGWEAC